LADNFCFPSPNATSVGGYLLELDGCRAELPKLREAQRLMSHACFAEALEILCGTLTETAATTDITLQAEAAGYIGWFHGELEQFDDARRWLIKSIRLIESHLQLKAPQVVQAISASGRLTVASERAIQILGRALRVYGKVLTVRIVHDLDYGLQSEAKRVLDDSTRLDECLRLPELAHSLRWKAAAISAEVCSTLQEVDTALAASRGLVASGTPGEASLIREQGLARWQKGRLAKAESLLLEAKARLTDFGDARAAGPAFCMLSKVTLQGGGSPRQAQRYALLGASLHPYGYVLRHCVAQMKSIPAEERLREFDQLIAGEKPFDTVHTVLAGVAQGSPASGVNLASRNLTRIRQALATPGA
jgi:hypothetical protein